ncbi:DNA polymerase iv protein [Mucor ambiguus]|uniref:DNA repair protein REV1 n=1 Tax=Mucor ambiguus TaxID=91626 RepID=A0A0C9M6W7_9FUNG|nr:DNA polymerase iv protein [Mucor ambiguus]
MSSQDESNDPYGAIKFGEFRKYMQNKQSKLKRQQKEFRIQSRGEQASQALPQIFAGTSIYINGYCSPPAMDLRRMILQHGGDYQHYLKKLSVTHIIATNLTNSKLQEFRSYKVVRPEWITESTQAQQLLPWQQYRLVPRATAQRELVFNTDSNSNTETPIEAIAEKISGETLNAHVLSNDWARQISTVNPTFIKRYYETSRLHYLSIWKAELKSIVEQLEEKYKSDPSMLSRKRKRLSASYTRVVMHVDFDCFFASVGIKDRPHLKELPVAVSHTKVVSEASSSDVASCNYVARAYGVRNGMTVGMAKGLCPSLQVIPYEFEKYKSISKIFYEIMFHYADEMQAVSVDEALLEVGSHFTQPDEHSQEQQQEALATQIRDEIRQATGCEASIGVGSNILLARMSTKKAKPAGQHICKSIRDVEELLSSQKVTDLPGVGYAIGDKLKELNITAVSDVRKVPLYELQAKLGSKIGQTLYNFSWGIDDRPLTTNQQRQSVSAEVNWGMRFEHEENEREFVEGLAKEVSVRLQKYNVKGKNITVKILKRKEDATQASKNLGHGRVDSFSKSHTLGHFTDDPAVINKHVYSMLKSFQFSSADIRGLGIHISKLDNQEKLSPDQGVLNFQSRPAVVVNEQQQQQNQAIEMGELSKQAFKETMEVDPYVYNELPLTVKQELESTYQLVFKEATHLKDSSEDQSTTHEIPQEIIPLIDTPLPELPPWSQLDPLSLLALPDDMREQILKTYASKEQVVSIEAVVESPPRTPTHQSAKPSVFNTPKIPQSTYKTRGGRSRTITQMFQSATSPSSTRSNASYNASSPSMSTNNDTTPTSRHSSRFHSVFQVQQRPQQLYNEPEDDLSYDADVWNQLPQDMKEELLEEHRRLKRLKSQQQHQQYLQKTSKDNHLPRDHAQKIDLEPFRKEPSLQGVTDVQEIRTLLHEWVHSFEDMPEPEDVETITSYLVELVHYADLEKVQLLVSYMVHLIRDMDSVDWKQCTSQIQANVSNAVKSVYGCPLEFKLE